ncbi:serine hydrolase domain-containing protein [Paenibacillus montanisoli]|uniref:Serine hydrolase n=1 Tax=Paenibacillus montanisoli TaxID=2081970 RepID=A0A328U2Z7_9BACL|nr:serine hydrolase [Paenibacillus montanisoli]RAP77168.1 serine hydrolase [Paenibacillus montanisoli]
MTQTELRLPRIRPEEAGIHPRAITALLDEWKERQIEIHSMMVLRHGQVAAEGWWAPYAKGLPHMLFSLSKSFTSTAIGLAAAEGLLTVDEKVLSYFPNDAPASPSINLQAMRIRHLLMMGTGHETDTLEDIKRCTDGNWVRAFLHAPVEREPGTHFVYNSGATYLLSAILQKVTGQKLLDYLRPRLLEPLGIAEATWEECPRGIHTGGWGLALTTEGIAKFGQLYLQKGHWEGKRIITEAWINEATSKQISNGDGGENEWAHGYGYQFWRCRHGAYRGDGAFGQFCIVMPEQDMVIAITAATNDMQAVMNAVWTQLLPAVEAGPIPFQEQDAERLTAQLAALKLEPPAVSLRSELEETVTGHRYALEANGQQWQAITFRFGTIEAAITIEREGGEMEETFIFGRGVWRAGKGQLPQAEPLKRSGNQPMVAAFTWSEPDTLAATLRFIETPFAVTVEASFADTNELELSCRLNVSFQSTDLLTARGIK